jgi:hypothetical protein
MKHVVILDDKNRQSKVENEFLAMQIKKGLKTSLVSETEVKKALQKMRGK